MIRVFASPLRHLVATIAAVTAIGVSWEAHPAAAQVADEVLAFPGAEGAGRFALGGRDGRVVRVTHLGDSGPGRLRAAVEADGPRTVTFDIGGVIRLVRVPRSELIDEFEMVRVPERQIRESLGWLNVIEVMQEHLEEMRAVTDPIRPPEIEDVVLLGMGGSSLAPEVFRLTFGQHVIRPVLLIKNFQIINAQRFTIDDDFEVRLPAVLHDQFLA